MGIIAWIVLGLGAVLLANMLIPGRRSQGFILTCMTGIAGAAILLLAYHLVTGRGVLAVPGAAPAGRAGEQADLAGGRTAAAARPMYTAGCGTAATRCHRAGAWRPGPHS